jgi:hypothetical protein
MSRLPTSYLNRPLSPGILARPEPLARRGLSKGLASLVMVGAVAAAIGSCLDRPVAHHQHLCGTGTCHRTGQDRFVVYDR